MLIVDRLARAPLSAVLTFAAIWTVYRLAIAPIIFKTPPHKQTFGYKFLKFTNDAADALVYAAIVVFFLVRPFGIQTFFIPTGSMIDTLMVNDIIVADKLTYRHSDPKAGEIVVFNPPEKAVRPGDLDADFIKRCAGAPGDIVEIKGREMFRNGKKLEEPYVDFTVPGTSRVLPETDWSNAFYPDFKLIEHEGQVIPVMLSEEGLANFGTYKALGGLTRYQGMFPASDVNQAREWAEKPAAAVPKGKYLFIGDNRNGSLDGRMWGLVEREAIIGRSWFIWLPFSRIGVTK